MKRRSQWSRTGHLVAASLVTIILWSCGGSSSEPEATAQPTAPTTTVTALSPGMASPPAGAAVATPLAGDAIPAASPPPNRAFVSERVDLGPLEWTAMVDPTTLAPSQPVQTFPTTASTIYATLPVRLIEAGTVVSASWTYNGAPIRGVESSLTITEEAADVWLEFHITRTQVPAWPDGDYAIVVQVDGEPALSSSVTVDDA